KLSHELIGLLFIFAAVLGLSNLGFMGILLANFFRFFFGENYQVPLALFGIFGLYLLIMGREPRIKKRTITASALSLTAFMLILHANTFQHVMASEGSVFQVTLMRFLADMRAGLISFNMGSVMIRATEYSVRHFLFLQWGTYALAVLFVFLSLCILFGFTIKDIMDQVRKGFATIAASFQRVFSPVFERVKVYFADKSVKESASESSVIVE